MKNMVQVANVAAQCCQPAVKEFQVSVRCAGAERCRVYRG